MLTQSCLPGTHPVGVLQVTVAVIKQDLSSITVLATRRRKPQEKHLSHWHKEAAIHKVYPGSVRGKAEMETNFVLK